MNRPGIQGALSAVTTWAPSDLPGKMASRIMIDPECGCWIGSPPHNADGYARLGQDTLHRAVWRELVGPLTPGLVLDHVEKRGCFSRACCWPGHLEEVTHRTNVLRGHSFAALNYLKTHCGHCGRPYDLFNTYTSPSGRRDCRACVARRAREYKLRLQGAELLGAAMDMAVAA